MGFEPSLCKMSDSAVFLDGMLSILHIGQSRGSCRDRLVGTVTCPLRKRRLTQTHTTPSSFRVHAAGGTSMAAVIPRASNSACVAVLLAISRRWLLSIMRDDSAGPILAARH